MAGDRPEPSFAEYDPERPDPKELVDRARRFREAMASRRSVRDFADRDVPREAIEHVLATAGSAPSGANMQPWSFVAVRDPDLKQRMRDAVEEVEREFYEERASDEWLDDLAKLGTDWEKPHITDAPWVIAVFAQDYGLAEDGTRSKHYYVDESVGIAVGLLVAAIHRAGLATLTHTPAPRRVLEDLLDRPRNERAYLLMPVGYPAEGCQVPDLERKDLDEIVEWR